MKFKKENACPLLGIEIPEQFNSIKSEELFTQTQEDFWKKVMKALKLC